MRTASTAIEHLPKHKLPRPPCDGANGECVGIYCSENTESVRHDRRQEVQVNEERFRKGQVVFRQGDPADSMYYIRWGVVGVYANYGQRGEEKLAELRTGDYFGEMGLLDHESRSATVVCLDSETVLNRISEKEFEEFLHDNPAKVVDILGRLSHKLRKATKSYLEICRAVEESVGSQSTVVAESTTYGFERNKTLKAIHDREQTDNDEA